MKRIIYITLILSFFTVSIKAQTIEDALKFAVPNGIITPRAAGMGVSYHGISDDLGALVYNPAGLGLIGRQELSFGLGFTRNVTESQFHQEISKFSVNNGFFNNAGVVSPFSSGDNLKGAVGIGYFRESDFENRIDFTTFNERTTMTAYEWALEGVESIVNDSLQQTTMISEDGGIHNLTGAMSFILNDFLLMGVSITGKWGSYTYDKSFREEDTRNIYNTLNPDEGQVNFTYYDLNQTYYQDIAGITGSLSLMGKLADFLRAGIVVKFPTYYSITGDYDEYSYELYDDGYEAVIIDTIGTSSYSLKVPFVYSGGVSVHGAGMTFSAGVEYTDVTQLEYNDGPEEFKDLNRIIEKSLVGQVTWGFGLEYEIPMVPITARASYTQTTSPYFEDVSNATLSKFAFGGSIYLGKSIRIDGVASFQDVTQRRTYYGADFNKYFETFDYTSSPYTIAMGLTYRY